MFVEYSAEGGIAQGLADTFSGERPCEWCLSADAAEAADPLPENAAWPGRAGGERTVVWLPAPAAPALTLRPAAVVAEASARWAGFAAARRDPPELGPPRAPAA